MKENKVAQKAERTIKEANKTAEFIIDNKYVFIGLGVLVGGYFVYKGIKNGLNGIGDGVKDMFAPIPDDNIKASISINESNLTISKSKAQNLAKALLDAFNDSGIFGGTDEKKIENVFKQIKSGDDFKLVYNVFSKRKYITGGTPTRWFDKKIAVEKDLIQWLKSELSSVFDRSLYKIVKDRVESAGMFF